MASSGSTLIRGASVYYTTGAEHIARWPDACKGGSKCQFASYPHQARYQMSLETPYSHCAVPALPRRILCVHAALSRAIHPYCNLLASMATFAQPSSPKTTAPARQPKKLAATSCPTAPNILHQKTGPKVRDCKTYLRGMFETSRPSTCSSTHTERTGWHFRAGKNDQNHNSSFGRPMPDLKCNCVCPKLQQRPTPIVNGQHNLPELRHHPRTSKFHTWGTAIIAEENLGTSGTLCCGKKKINGQGHSLVVRPQLPDEGAIHNRMLLCQ